MQMLITPPLFLAAVAALLFAGGAFAAKLLSKSGAGAAALVGFVVFGLGGGLFMIPLLTFFFTSSLLSKLGKSRKSQANRGDAKGSVRDAAQVFANGGVAALLVLVFASTVRHASPMESRSLLLFYLASLSAANADTWATEFGKLSSRLPRRLTDWKLVSAGTSGAISPLGTLGAALGAGLIPLSALPFWNLNPAEWIAPALCGFAASWIDSVLGATVQAKFTHPVTGELTEKSVVDGKPSVRVSGLRLLTNDGVNFLACAAGAVLCWLFVHFAIQPYQ